MRLEAREIAANRGGERLFLAVSFDLASGESLVLKGKNGTGKSTLIRTVAGLLPLEEGSVTLTLDDGRTAPRAAEACHYLGHRNAMKKELTVEENLQFWKSFFGDYQGRSGMEIDEAADALGLIGLLHLPFGYLSAGQQRRMAMAKLLTAWRPVWLLDEPTAALDSQSESLFARLMKTHLDQGGLIIAATHQPLALDGARELVMTGFDYLGEAA
ncbi:heme ABC exporter ATP-binding protein CcmA [Rhizobium sp. TRM95796]|uniref:heme ABC exporter ATP-binding protein CcmA n=1 Tax=Rhizobium sp. TRM95796 TaxID=2979862 RepID=UPI0021E7A434|nr:heme ABC exporter ATP-binding protein CcmA [Rhizobium sp. TRM95796]MCV3767470.1 heme ABC exporter ATP-binding protein CcmA [Rhizobium sp. TRM95796]